MKIDKKFPTLLISFICLFILCYDLKALFGFDLFDKFHLGLLPIPPVSTELTIKPKQIFLINDDFRGTNFSINWGPLWAKDNGSVEAEILRKGNLEFHGFLISSSSEKEWSCQSSRLIDVSEGEILNYSVLMKCLGDRNELRCGVVLYDATKKALNWHFATSNIRDGSGWVKVDKRFAVPPEVSYVRFRFTGTGKGKALIDNIKFIREGNPGNVSRPGPGGIGISNSSTSVLLDSGKIRVETHLKGFSKNWQSDIRGFLIDNIQKLSENKISFVLIEPESLNRYDIILQLDQGQPKIEFLISSGNQLDFSFLDFPDIFNMSEGAEFFFPMREGVLIPKSELGSELSEVTNYHGYALSIPFFGGFESDGSGWIEIIETPFDLKLKRITDIEGNVSFVNCWNSEKGKFGYSRKISFLFFEQGGYVEMAKQYRKHAQKMNLLISLKEKEKRNNNLRKLVGATNVWFWGYDKQGFARELEANGIKKVLFSNCGSSENVLFINKLGYLTSKYENYQDVYPQIYHEVINMHEGWPEDLVLDSNGVWVKGWVTKRNGKNYQSGIVCSSMGLERAKKNITLDLKTCSYAAHFLDTTTSAPWRECYNPKHQVTKFEDSKCRIKLLKFCSEEMGLVTGSEDGVADAVPFVDYSEGMMSIKGRLPDSGRNVSKVQYMEPTDQFIKYQVGVKYRIPLWELIFHDCVATTWYWGDSSNRIPEMWWRKDLLNILYGNMPLWAIRDHDYWKQNKKRFIESYNNVCPVFEKVGFLEMLNHRFVTEDRTVQETQFEGDVRIFVNFNEAAPFELKELKYTLSAKGFVVFEKGKVWKEGKSS